MAVLELNQSNFDETIQNNDIVVLDFEHHGVSL